jgi:hypothetical protein
VRSATCDVHGSKPRSGLGTITLDNLGSKRYQKHKQLHDQQALIQEVQSMVSNTREQTTSILTTATDIIVLATSGVIKLRLITRQLSRMLERCTRFTTYIRAAMAELSQLFYSLHTILRRIENYLPRRVYLPIFQFTNTLGKTIPLPYQLFNSELLLKDYSAWYSSTKQAKLESK